MLFQTSDDFKANTTTIPFWASFKTVEEKGGKTMLYLCYVIFTRHNFIRTLTGHKFLNNAYSTFFDSSTV